MNSQTEGDDPSASTQDEPPLPSPVDPAIEPTHLTGHAKETGTPNPDQTSELRRQFKVFEIASFAVQVVLAIIGIGAICIYSGQLGVMRGQLRQMENATRPWIGIEENGIGTGPLKVDERGWISTVVNTTAKNFGNHPGSIQSSIFVQLVVADVSSASKVVSEQLDEFLKSTLPRGYGPLATLFPLGTKRYMNTTFVTPTRIKRQPAGGPLTAFLVGEIVYTDPARNVHHTCFSYWYQAPSEIPRGVEFEDIPGSSIPTGVWVEWRTITD